MGAIGPVLENLGTLGLSAVQIGNAASTYVRPICSRQINEIGAFGKVCAKEGTADVLLTMDRERFGACGRPPIERPLLALSRCDLDRVTKAAFEGPADQM